MCKVFAYLRISTGKQDLENQRHELSGYAARNGLTIDEWIEVEISSKKSTANRRVDELVGLLKKQDVLIVPELSRLARSMRETLNIMHLLTKKKVCVHLIKENIRTNGETSAVTEMLMANLSFAAQLEREMISTRTKAALAQKKANGVQLGNPRIRVIADQNRNAAIAYAEELRPVLEELVDAGRSQRQILEELNAKGLKTSKDNAWSLLTLQKTMTRLGLKTKRTKKL
jgi:DNA invertase Pin-like site-specific DNA recombinase